MLADSQYDSVAQSQLQPLNEDLVDYRGEDEKVPLQRPSVSQNSFSFDANVSRALEFWKQEPSVAQRVFLAPLNVHKSIEWIKTNLLGNLDSSDSKALTLEMLSFPAMASFMTKNMEPDTLEHLVFKIIEPGISSMEDERILEAFTNHRIRFSDIDWKPLVLHLLSQTQNGKLTLPALGILANLGRVGPLRDLITSTSGNSKSFYKGLSPMIADDDERKVGLSLTIFASLVFDGPVGQRIFRPDNLTETFKLIFTTMGNEEDEQLRIIYLKLAEILLSKERGKKAFVEFGNHVWNTSAGFPWCAAKNVQVFGMFHLLSKHNLFPDMIGASVTEFDLIKKACCLFTVSDNACLFLLEYLKRPTFASKLTASVLNTLLDIPIDTVVSDSCNLNLLTEQILDSSHLQNFIFKDNQLLLQKRISKINFDMAPFLFGFYIKLAFKILGEDSLDKLLADFASLLKETKNEGDILYFLQCIKHLDHPLIFFKFTSCVRRSQNSTGVSEKKSLSALSTSHIQELELKLNSALTSFQDLLAVKDGICASKIAEMNEQVDSRIQELEKKQKNEYESYETRVASLLREKDEATERETSISCNLETTKKELKDKYQECSKLSLTITKRDQEIVALRQRIQELEDTIGDQEVEHEEMVAKLAQSLDALSKRKPRTTKKAPVQPPKPMDLDSLDEKFHNTSLTGL